MNGENVFLSGVEISDIILPCFVGQRNRFVGEKGGKKTDEGYGLFVYLIYQCAVVAI